MGESSASMESQRLLRNKAKWLPRCPELSPTFARFSAGPLHRRDVLAPPRGNRQREHSALVGGEFSPRASSYRFDRLAHDTEAETGTRGVRHSLAVSPVKLLEQTLATISRNTDSVVADANHHFSVMLGVGAFDRRRDGYPPLRFFGVGVLDAV